MKRFLILILTVSLMVPWMAGCGGSESSSGGSGGAGVPNPRAQISLSQFQADTGFEVDLYDGYELGEVYKINTDPVIYGLGITDENGVEYDVRLAKTDNLVEISGMNYQWTYTNDPGANEDSAVSEEGETTEETQEATEETQEAAEPEAEAEAEPEEEETAVPDYYFYFTDDGQGMITWYEDQYSWSVSAVENATKAGMQQMYDDLYGMVSF